MAKKKKAVKKTVEDTCKSIVGGILGSDSDDLPTVEENTNYAKALSESIIKEFGEIFKKGDNILSRRKRVIPVSPALDLVLGGGVPEGSWVLCSGDPKSGKTSLSLAFAAQCQKPENGSRHVYYFDVEARLKPMNIEGTAGLRLDMFHHIKSEKGNILNAEKFLTIAEKTIHGHPGSLIIIDSTSALCADKEMTGEITASARHQGPKLLACFCRKLANVVPVNDCIVWMMQHLIANTTGYGLSKYEDGGNYIQYQEDIKLRVKSFEPWKVGSDENAKRIGQKVHWQMITSALGGIPGSTATGYLRFGTGVDHLQELIVLACSLGFVKVAGSWFTYGEVKVQGEPKLYKYFQENPEEITKLQAKIKAMYTGSET